jgi:hypothetical protein
VCVERSAHCVACEAWRAKCCVRRVLRRVRRGRRVGRRRARGGGGLSYPLRRAVSARCGCAGARWRAEARNVLRAKRGAQSVVCVVCYALYGAMGARAGSECEAAVGRESAASRLAGRCGCVCARVMSGRRVMLRIGRRAKRMAHNVRRAWCAAHRAGRSARGPEASARRRRAVGGSLRHGALARRGARACGWVPRARRGAHRLRTVRCGRRASWRRVRGGGGLGGSLRRGLRGVPAACVRV